MTDPSTQKHPLTRKQVQALPTECLGSFQAATKAYISVLDSQRAGYVRELDWIKRERKSRGIGESLR